MSCTPNIYRVTTLENNGPGSLLDGLLYAGTPETPRWIVFEVSGTIVLDATHQLIESAKHIHVFGNTSPFSVGAGGGGIQIVGWPMALVDCEDITISNVAWSLGIAPDPSNDKWWNPIKVLTSSPGQMSRDISFLQCSFRGGQDENDMGPLNHSAWDWDVTAIEDLTFDSCLFAWCFDRANGDHHNMSLMTNATERAVIRRCLMAHNNRRSPQCHGSAAIVNNVVYNYGSSAVACMAGGEYTVKDNTFMPGPQSRVNPPWAPISIQPNTNFSGDTHIHMAGNLRTQFAGIPASSGPDLFDNQDEDATAYFPEHEPIRDWWQGDVSDPQAVIENAGTIYRDAWDVKCRDTISQQTGGWARTEHAIGGIPVYPELHSQLVLPSLRPDDLKQWLNQYRPPGLPV